MTPSILAERREFSRFGLKPRAVLRVGKASVVCSVTDISLGGALVSTDTTKVTAVEGQPCTLTIHLDFGTSVIQMKGAIAHVGAGRLGVACRDTDLDSFGHLRRVLELNLGEEKLVRNELAALARQR